MLLLLSAIALASDCPDVGDVVDQAWAAFEDAELEIAGTHLDEAAASLPCQQRLVETVELLGLYQLEGLLALAEDDRSGAIYATIRIVTTDPDARPSEEMGPDFQELHATWKERLAASRVELTWHGDGRAWVDGRPLPGGDAVPVIVGEHLLQVETDAGWYGLFTDVDADGHLALEGGSLVVAATPPAIVPVPVPVPAPVPSPEPDPRPRPRTRVGLVVGGGLSLAAGIAAIAYGYDREQRFDADPYDPRTFDGCAAGTACYEAAREKRIRRDAAIIDGLYGGGYGLTAVGVVFLGLELFLLPDPVAGGGSVRVRVHW